MSSIEPRKRTRLKSTGKDQGLVIKHCVHGGGVLVGGGQCKLVPVSSKELGFFNPTVKQNSTINAI